MGTPLGPKYIPYTYMDPLGKGLAKPVEDLARGSSGLRSLSFRDQGLGRVGLWVPVDS